MSNHAPDPLAFAKSIQGWMGDTDLLWLYNLGRMYQGGCIVEVGSWKGRSLAAIAAGMQTGQLLAVDNISGKHSWDAEPDSEDQANHLRHNLGTLRLYYPDLSIDFEGRNSIDAALHYNGACPSAVFIDGDHRPEHVRADIRAWRPLVIEGGIVCGHDWGQVRETVVGELDGVDHPRDGAIWFWAKG